MGKQPPKLLEGLITELGERAALAHPDPRRRFYLKTDWSQCGMAAALSQADPKCKKLQREEEEEEAERNGEKCTFDSDLSKLRLRRWHVHPGNA